jgi:hypothetical protein
MKTIAGFQRTKHAVHRQRSRHVSNQVLYQILKRVKNQDDQKAIVWASTRQLTTLFSQWHRRNDLLIKLDGHHVITLFELSSHEAARYVTSTSRDELIIIP